MYTLKELQKMNALRKDMKLLDINSPEFVTVAEYRTLAKDGKADGKIPVIDNAQWVAVTSKGIYHAMGADGRMSKIKKGQKDLKIQALKNGVFGTVEIADLRETQADYDEAERRFAEMKSSGELDKILGKTGITTEMPIGKNNNTNDKKEDINMSNGLNIADITASLQAQSESANLANETQRMDLNQGISLNGGTDAIAPKEELESEVPMHLIEVGNFNRDNGGCLVCLVTDKDARVQASAKKASSSKVRGGAGADFEAAGASDAATSTEGTDNSSVLSFSQSTPGKILGGVVRIPTGGFFTISELDSGEKNGQPLEVDYDRKDLKSMLLDDETLKAFVAYAFNSQIPECKETYGPNAGTTRVQVNTRDRKDRKTKELKSYTEIVLKTDRGGKVLSPNAYFPIKTYETIAVNDKLTQEQVDVLNLSAFYSLFNKTKSATAEPAAKLRLEDRRLIDRVDENGVVRYTSEYFKADGTGLGINVRPWYGAKSDVLSNPEIPVKEIKRNEEKGTQRAVVKTINCLKDQGAPGYNELSSLTSGRFDNVIEQSNGELNLESLKKTFGKEAKGGKKQEKLATSAQQLSTFRREVLTKKSTMDLMLKKFK